MAESGDKDPRVDVREEFLWDGSVIDEGLRLDPDRPTITEPCGSEIESEERVSAGRDACDVRGFWEALSEVEKVFAALFDR